MTEIRNIRNILLIGKTGNGKSTLGNVILGENKFAENEYAVSGTRDIQVELTEIGGIKYRIIDTIGIGDTQLSLQQVLNKLADISHYVKDGLNQVLFVTSGKFTEEEIFAYNLLRTVIFDESITKHTAIVRTRFSGFRRPEKCAEDKEKMTNENENISEIVKSCNKLIHVNNMNEDEEPSQKSRQDSRIKLITYLRTCQENYNPEYLDNLDERISNYITEKDKLQKEVEEIKQDLANNQEENSRKLQEIEEKRLEEARRLEKEKQEAKVREDKLQRELEEQRKMIEKMRIEEQERNRKKCLGIVGFSYEVTNGNSAKPWITKRELGRKTDNKKEIAHSENWSEEYGKGYGHSSAYLGDKGPFYSIVGGYTDYTSEDSKKPSVKWDEWGKKEGEKFCISEGYSWNPFLNWFGYHRSYIYLEKRERVSNVVGWRTQSTSKDSKSPWIETYSIGTKNGKETIWTKAYSWSREYSSWFGNGYNHFSLYTDDSIIENNSQQLEAKVEVPPK